MFILINYHCHIYVIVINVIVKYHQYHLQMSAISLADTLMQRWMFWFNLNLRFSNYRHLIMAQRRKGSQPKMDIEKVNRESIAINISSRLTPSALCSNKVVSFFYLLGQNVVTNGLGPKRPFRCLNWISTVHQLFIVIQARRVLRLQAEPLHQVSVKSRNFVKVLKFGKDSEIESIFWIFSSSLKSWALMEILKFGQNSETWSKFWNLVTILEAEPLSTRSQLTRSMTSSSMRNWKWYGIGLF